MLARAGFNVTLDPADDHATPNPAPGPSGTVDPTGGAGHSAHIVGRTTDTGDLADTIRPTISMGDLADTIRPTTDTGDLADTIPPGTNTGDSADAVEPAVGGRAGAGVTQSLGVTLSKAPRAVTFMLATEILRLRRIVSTRGRVTHCGQLPGAEQLSLPHT